MDPRAHFSLLARYGAWATGVVCDHVARLSDDEYRRDLGLFFKSVHGTLNHLLVTEHHLWYPRFAEGASPALALNAELEPDRARLCERLAAGAARWEPLIASWDDARFAGMLDYTSTQGIRRSMPFAAALTHVFNHGTHHRGQISAAFTVLGHRPGPELDLLLMPREEQRR
jgi:uncharacterized damage-inducible protein DinB